MADPLLDFCDTLVAAVNAADTPLDCAASWQDDPIVDLAKTPLETAIVWVVDFARSHKTGRNEIPVEELQVLVIVQQRLPALAARPAACRALAGLAAWLEDYCHITPVANYTCIGTQRLPAREWAKYTEEGLYRAEILTHWQCEEGD